jgi:hypothetical protein
MTLVDVARDARAPSLQQRFCGPIGAMPMK